jgi:multidrug efflux pump subunit AcrB
MAAMEQVANEVLPAGFGYAWSDMSYQEKKAKAGKRWCLECLFCLCF